MERYAKDAAGYVHVVSVMGVTGARKQLPPDIINTLLLAKATFSIPLALGFGLIEPSQIAMFPEAARPDVASSRQYPRPWCKILCGQMALRPALCASKSTHLPG